MKSCLFNSLNKLYILCTIKQLSVFIEKLTQELILYKVQLPTQNYFIYRSKQFLRLKLKIIYSKHDFKNWNGLTESIKKNQEPIMKLYQLSLKINS